MTDPSPKRTGSERLARLPAPPGDPLDPSLVQRAYEDLDNYRIESGRIGSNTCAVYFSGHGLYYPNTRAVFTKQILDKDRYEWFKTRVPGAGRHIFVRDVHKQWYVEGINGRCRSHEELRRLLAAETAGQDLVTVGSSAGGYAAALFGCLLNASHVLCFSGQFSLGLILGDDAARSQNDLLARAWGDGEKGRYLELRELVAGGDTPVFYFFPAYNPEDVDQYRQLAGTKNLYPFCMKSTRMGCHCTRVPCRTCLGSDARRCRPYGPGPLRDPEAVSACPCGSAARLRPSHRTSPPSSISKSAGSRPV